MSTDSKRDGGSGFHPLPADAVSDAAAPPPGVAATGIVLEIAYSGTAFHGWARQETCRTVADTVQRALTKMDPNASLLRGASRTDAGVHAEGQVAAFDTAMTIPLKGWVLGINQQLPEDVSIRAARRCPVGFEPRFACTGKRYRYGLRVDPVRHPFWEQNRWRIPSDLDVESMQLAAQDFVGTHHFGAFHSARDERSNLVRNVLSVDVHVEEHTPCPPRVALGNLPAPRNLSVVVVGTAFLYNMVRIMTGTLVEIGRGRRELGAIRQALASGIRTDAGVTAPAHALTLEAVFFDPPFIERWPPR
jgi:tRNA pseudouridine38-40 synthase